MAYVEVVSFRINTVSAFVENPEKDAVPLPVYVRSHVVPFTTLIADPVPVTGSSVGDLDVSFVYWDNKAVTRYIVVADVLLNIICGL